MTEVLTHEVSDVGRHSAAHSAHTGAAAHTEVSYDGGEELSRQQIDGGVGSRDSQLTNHGHGRRCRLCSVPRKLVYY